MRSRIPSAALAAALTCFLASACTADVHDNVINVDEINVEMETDADVDNIQPGSSMPVTVKVDDNVVLVDPGTTPPPEDVDVAVHFRIFLDDTDSQPLLITAQTQISVTIPASTQPGDHKIICRVHKHDGSATEATAEIKIKVKASVTTSG